MAVIIVPMGMVIMPVPIVAAVGIVSMDVMCAVAMRACAWNRLAIDLRWIPVMVMTGHVHVAVFDAMDD
jgi:hypothetical protein